MSPALRALTLAAAIGCGAVGGVFFGFSGFVMAGLARLPAAQGIAAMQSINVAAVRPAFLSVLLGSAAACVPLAVAGARSWGERPAGLLLAGSGLYVVGTVGLTIAYHVPRNDALAALDPASAQAAQHWAGYLREWTAANHVRAAAALAAAGAFAAALRD